jgi:hypothetical protein
MPLMRNTAIADRWLARNKLPGNNAAVEGDQKRTIRKKSENRETMLAANVAVR